MNPSSILAYLTSAKTLLAIVVATAVTGVVAGPLAQQAVEARDALAETRDSSGDNGGNSRDGGRDNGRDGGADELASTTSTTTSTTTTTSLPTVEDPDSTDDPESIAPTWRTTTTVRRPTTTTPDGSIVTAPPVIPPPPTEAAILVSVSPDHSLANPLEGTEVSGAIFVLVEGVTLADSSWTLDDLPLIAGVPLDTSLLPVGEHRIEVEVQTSSGPVTSEATFTVVR